LIWAALAAEIMAGFQNPAIFLLSVPAVATGLQDDGLIPACFGKLIGRFSDGRQAGRRRIHQTYQPLLPAHIRNENKD
jgi:hypothetical protein